MLLYFTYTLGGCIVMTSAFDLMTDHWVAQWDETSTNTDTSPDPSV